MSLSDTVPPPSKIKSLQAIMKLQPRPGCEWCVMAYALNKDMITDQGSLDNFYGMAFCLGGFSDRDEAERHAKHIISTTGHPAVCVVKYGYPAKLQTNYSTETVTQVYVDSNKQIVELESQQYKQEKEAYEKHLKLEQELIKEAEDETLVDHIEHFKRQCYLAIKNKSTINHLKSQISSAELTYEKCKNAVRKHYAAHPEHEEEWLPYLKEKLTERGELSLFNSLEQGYNEIRSELLGLSVSSSD